MDTHDRLAVDLRQLCNELGDEEALALALANAPDPEAERRTQQRIPRAPVRSSERRARLSREAGWEPEARSRTIRPARYVGPSTRRRGAGRPRTRTVCARSSARSGDSGDDGPAEPSPARLTLWRHPRWGACSPHLLRLLEAVQR